MPITRLRLGALVLLLATFVFAAGAADAPAGDRSAPERPLRS